ncbi:conjugal transfer protein MobC [Pedobacter aquatilis]|uniref:conjugal transfer protein MobC n=1 Tax=Pedobacter aquatilis TaxID=351343 RepID=UPI00292E4115|nr:conjugal transfer protein MobC [Pedobacter aquatilis]
MNTGEDVQGLRKIMDFSRLISICILSLHFYLSCYSVFLHWGLTSKISDRIIDNLSKINWLNGITKPKLSSLLFLLISLLGVRGRKDEQAKLNWILSYFAVGVVIYGLSYLTLYLERDEQAVAITYMVVTLAGYLMALTGGARLSRLIKGNLNQDVFNHLNETFPQEERLLENEYSINLPTRYALKKETRTGWINIINPFRSILVAGSGGAGKTYFVIRHIISQQISKGYSMFLYDFKFDDLTRLAYNYLLKYRNAYPVAPQCYIINFEDLSRSHRCNPLSPESMEDITDASEASRTILMGLNKDWLKKQGDFFVESPINFLTAVIWFLAKYENGRYCTLPHAIELIGLGYKELFALLEKQVEVKVLINPFVSAMRNNAQAQLEGQIASAKIGLARLSSPQLYYVLSGDDFSLDINNPNAPKIVCMGNNPQKIDTYGAVLSLYVNRMLKLINKKDKLKCSLVFDEYPTLVANLITTIATGRSNLISCTLGIQSIEQVKKEYGAEQAEIIMGICANILCGQVSGDSAKKLSETFGKIMQDRQSLSINSSDVSVSKSTQMDYAIPASKIATLSSGEFVGLVADSPQEKIPQKMFHAELQNDHEGIKKEEAAWVVIPEIRKVTIKDVQVNYLRIKKEVADFVRKELAQLDEGGRAKKGNRKEKLKRDLSLGRDKDKKQQLSM